MHEYYIAYAHNRGFGATGMACPGPLAEWSDVAAVASDISIRNGLSNVVILSFQKYDDVATVAPAAAVTKAGS